MIPLPKNCSKQIQTRWTCQILPTPRQVLLYICLTLSISTCQSLGVDEINDMREYTEDQGIYFLENKSMKKFEKVNYEELKIPCI